MPVCFSRKSIILRRDATILQIVQLRWSSSIIFQAYKHLLDSSPHPILQCGGTPNTLYCCDTLQACNGDLCSTTNPLQLLNCQLSLFPGKSVAIEDKLCDILVQTQSSTTDSTNKPQSMRWSPQRNDSSVGSGASWWMTWPIECIAGSRYRYGSNTLRIKSFSLSVNLNHEYLFRSMSYSKDIIATTIGNMDAWTIDICSSIENVRKPKNTKSCKIQCYWAPAKWTAL